MEFQMNDRCKPRCTCAEDERQAAPRWYTLPQGWTWAKVAARRAEYDVPAGLYPLATAGGVAAWGVPLKPKRDRIRVPRTIRHDHSDFLMTAGLARRLPGGQLAARKALDNARFWRVNNHFVPAWG